MLLHLFGGDLAGLFAHLNPIDLILQHPKIVIAMLAATIAGSIALFQVAALEFWLNAKTLLAVAVSVFALLFISVNNDNVALKAQVAGISQQLTASQAGQAAVSDKVATTQVIAKKAARLQTVINSAPPGTALDSVMDDLANAQAH